MSQELKPCPFCGRTSPLEVTDSNKIDLLTQSDYAFDDNPTFAVVCNKNKEGCGSSSGFWDTQKQAVIAWNTRTTKGSE